MCGPSKVVLSRCQRPNRSNRNHHLCLQLFKAPAAFCQLFFIRMRRQSLPGFLQTSISQRCAPSNRDRPDRPRWAHCAVWHYIAQQESNTAHCSRGKLKQMHIYERRLLFGTQNGSVSWLTADTEAKGNPRSSCKGIKIQDSKNTLKKLDCK